MVFQIIAFLELFVILILVAYCLYIRYELMILRTTNEWNKAVVKKFAEQEEEQMKTEYEKLKERSKEIVEFNSKEPHVPDYLL